MAMPEQQIVVQVEQASGWPIIIGGAIATMICSLLAWRIRIWLMKRSRSKTDNG